MALAPEVKEEFLRSVYDAGADFAARKKILDGYRNVALKAIGSGKTIIGASGAGVSSQYEQIQGYQPDIVISLVRWARPRIVADDIEAAIAMAPIDGVTLVRAQFSGLRG